MNLLALAGLEHGDARLHRAVDHALERLDGGHVEPHFVPMHGDFWAGNILSARNPDSYPFAVIDWRGSETNGYPIFDLIRLAGSYHFTARRLRDELERHARILGCTVEDTRIHLLAAIGHFAVDRGEMPVDALLKMAIACHTIHNAAVRGA
jgi:aminoglycoside phosphotransferase (APT) family kinase protein